MKNIKDKLNEILDFDMEAEEDISGDEVIDELERMHNIKLPEEYAYYLTNYKTNYIKDSYNYVNNKNKYSNIEIDSLFGTMKNVNNILQKNNFYKKYIPEFLISIGDIAGGDLICMHKLTKAIYVWIHDSEENINYYFIEDSFKDFISNIRLSKEESKDDLRPKSVNFSPKLLKMLNNIDPKYLK